MIQLSQKEIEMERKRMEKEKLKYELTDNDDIQHKETAFLENKGINIEQGICEEPQLVNSNQQKDTNINNDGMMSVPSHSHKEPDVKHTSVVESTTNSDDSNTNGDRSKNFMD